MSIVKRTTQSGERRYDVRLRRPDGTVRNKTFRTLREAEAYERGQLSARDRGTWTDPRAGRVLLKDMQATGWRPGRSVVARWRYSRSSPYQYLLDNYILPTFGDLAISQSLRRTCERGIGTCSGGRPIPCRRRLTVSCMPSSRQRSMTVWWTRPLPDQRRRQRTHRRATGCHPGPGGRLGRRHRAPMASPNPPRRLRTTAIWRTDRAAPAGHRPPGRDGRGAKPAGRAREGSPAADRSKVGGRPPADHTSRLLSSTSSAITWSPTCQTTWMPPSSPDHEVDYPGVATGRAPGRRLAGPLAFPTGSIFMTCAT